MRPMNESLFGRLKNRSNTFATCWLITRKDGQKFGFTTYDREFTFEDVTFYPHNGMSPDAVQEKNDFSTNNSAARIIFGGEITEHDVRIGLFDYADVRTFWVDPNHLGLGSIPLQLGYLGEVTLQNNEFKAEVRSLLDLLQLPYGKQYNLECDAKLGDSSCGVPMNPSAWTPNTMRTAHIAGDARVGAVVKPTVDNGFWYLCVDGTQSTMIKFPRGTSYSGLGADPFVGTGYNPFNWLGPEYGVFWAQIFAAQLSQPSTTPGTQNVVTITLHGGTTGATEPTWPTTLGATVTDGQVTWKAIPKRIVDGSVTGVISRTQFQDASRTEEDGIFQYGVLKWTSGENSGRTVEVRAFKQSTTSPPQFTVLEVMPCPIHVDDAYQVTWGCSKIRGVCRVRYDNMLNYRGFPDMPTEDRALTTPNFSTAQDLTFSSGDSGGKK
jgi:hypothetical protein